MLAGAKARRRRSGLGCHTAYEYERNGVANLFMVFAPCGRLLCILPEVHGAAASIDGGAIIAEAVGLGVHQDGQRFCGPAEWAEQKARQACR
jgi:hypothetical protein